MTADYPTDEVPATPEYVLAVLRDVVQSEFPEDELTFDSSPIEIVNAFNELAWSRTRVLADVVNSIFAVNIPLSEWRAEFPMLRHRTVREVCEFVAPRITRPVIRPWQHITGECLPAGAFLTVRSLMVRAGANPCEITPSAMLGPQLLRLYRQKSLWELTRHLTRTAPGRLPQVGISCGALEMAGNRAAGLGLLILLLSLLFTTVGAGGFALALMGLACLMFPLAFLFGFLSSLQPPRAVEFTGLITFRDLAYTLAGQQPPRQIQPSA